MNAVLKLIMFSLILNFASGILLHMLPVYNDNPMFITGLEYNPNESVRFVNGLNGSVNPSSELEDAGQQGWRILDFINIGWVGRIINTFDNYMFGFVRILQTATAPYLESAASLFLFGTFRALVTIGYLLAGVWLWTNKQVLQ